MAATACLLALAASGSLRNTASSAWTPPTAEVLPDPLVELVVITRTTPSVEAPARDGSLAGLEYDLVTRFAADLGTKVRFVEATSYADALARLRGGSAHMLAADIAATAELKRDFLFGPPYRTSKQVLVRAKSTPRASNLDALIAKRVAYAPESSGAKHIEAARLARPALQWREIATDHPEQVLREVTDGRADYGVTSTHLLDLARGVHPGLETTLTVGPSDPVAWAFPKTTDRRFLQKVRRFFARIAADGTLDRLIDRYHGHALRLDIAEASEFREAIEARLEPLKPLFQRAQHETGIDWRFLAALAFQESKWDPRATSPTGVRGLMMLTEETAARMGVRDRTDARESVTAGAHYFKTLRDSMPARIPEPDRSWLALAAYNQGLGHLEDARVLAQRLGLNADTWVHVRQALPLLADEEHFSTLRHGYARGGEALVLTEKVRAYYQALIAQEPAWTPPPVTLAREPAPRRLPFFWPFRYIEDAFVL